MYQRIRQTALRSAADTAANDKLTGTGRGRSFEQHESATIVAYSGRDTGAKRSAPGRTRTFDLRIRNPLLYPAELRAQNTGKIAFADGLAFSSCYSTVNAVKQKNRQNTGKNVASKSFTPGVIMPEALANGKEIWKTWDVTFQPRTGAACHVRAASD